MAETATTWEQSVGTTTDCRSEEGITVGLIDSIIALAHVLVERKLASPAVQEALADLRDDPELQTILGLV